MQISRLLRDHHRLAELLVDELRADRMTLEEERGREDELRKLLSDHLRIEREVVDPLLPRVLVAGPGLRGQLAAARHALHRALEEEERWQVLGARMRDYFAVEEEALLPALEEVLDPRDNELLGNRAQDLEASEHRT